jgi:hypothetical protein
MGNPDSAQEQDDEIQIDKPSHYYVASYTVSETGTETETDTFEPYPSCLYGYQWDYYSEIGSLSGSWGDDAGGSSSWNWEGISDNSHAGSTNDGWCDVVYDTNFYPNIVEDTVNTSDDDVDNPFGIAFEHCDIGAPTTDFSGSYVDPPNGYECSYDSETEKDTGACNAQATMEFQPGGKAIPGQQNLYVINSSATQYFCTKWPIPLWASPMPVPSAPVPEQSIEIGALGNLDTNGNLYFVLPAGAGPTDVTPRVPGMPCFTFAANQLAQYTLVHQTESTAVGNTNNARTTIGVGELVDLSGMPANTIWSIQGGGSLSATNGGGTTFTAPSNTGPSTVTVFAQVGAAQLSVPFTVLSPTGYASAQIVSTMSFAVGQAAAEMHLNVTMGPTNVSFYRVQFEDVGEDATNVTGYFTNYSATNLFHNPGNQFLYLKSDNTWPYGDECAVTLPAPPLGPPWSAGGCTWQIPALWKVGDNGPTNSISGWNQVFSMDANATITIQKFGHSVTRTTNNVITTI